jgi:4-hydroxythreonine-4-phosphate dehydrogenase
MAKIRVGITIGDPSGIGPAITLKAIQKLKNLADFVVIGDSWVLNRVSRCQGLKVSSVRVIDLNNVVHKNFAFGKIKAEYGKASLEYLDKALELICATNISASATQCGGKDKEIDCLVTCPVSKEAVSLSGLDFRGHTEYLAWACGIKDFVMLLLNRYLKISLVSRHIALRRVPLEITKDKLSKTILITNSYLKKYFCLKTPRIVVCGLNPHASDNGLIGKEENRIIKPVLEKFKGRLNLEGPLPADIAMYKAFNREYDCAIAMYHDQALIALKLTDIQSGVNMTLGLPFIRTSPLHGTAFDKAKRPALADPSSLIQAIKLAVKCSTNLKKD